MKKRFKTSKKRNFYLRIIMFFITFLFSLCIGLKLINYFLDKKITEDIIISYLLGENNFNLPKILNIKDKNFFLSYSLNINNNEKEIAGEDLEDLTTGEYLEDPKKEEISLPIIYLYNTHQTEEYQKDYLEPYSIKPTVMLTSYMLREQLNDLGIPTIVETREVKRILNENNWKYGRSYQVSRTFLEDAKNKNSTLELFIDIHRDSVSRGITTINIDGKSYAKVLFVIGLEHESYTKNLALAEEIDGLINKEYPGLSRGIYKKEGQGVDGIYNQDISSNIMLIEVGGVDNNIDEVLNTTEALANILFKYINGDKNE